MPLILHEIFHISFSLVTAFIFYVLYRFADVSLFPLIIAGIMGGVLIDTDHFIDYHIYFKWDFKLHHFLKSTAMIKNQKLYILFHGYEYILVLIIIGFLVKNATLQASVFTLAISALLHLFVDLQLNGVFIQSYSILFRLTHSFRSKYLTISGR